MSFLCRYAGALGEPGKGAHAPRLAGFAAVDILGTAAIAYLLARRKGGVARFIVYFLLLVLLAVFVHELFCVNTRLNALLFGRKWTSAPPAVPPPGRPYLRSQAP